MNQSLSIFSFFSGAGFLDLGFEKSGYNVVFVNELHKPFMDTYKYSRLKMGIKAPKYGYFQNDINLLLNTPQKEELSGQIKAERVQGGKVGFIGGPPCPDFSIGGKNRGLEGDHGKLSASYFHLICEQKPDFFVFENVKGLWKTKKHRAFYEQMKVLALDAGYLLTERLINSIEYGVPQDRERIILIGFLSTTFPALQTATTTNKGYISDFPWDKHIKYSSKEIFCMPWPNESPFMINNIMPCFDGIPEDLTVEYWFSHNNVENHPNARHCFKPRAGLARFETVSEGDVSKKSYKRLHRWRYSPTACYGNNEAHLHPYKPRRLNVAEVLAIQSLPKEYELPLEMSLSNMFKTVGNGVPFLAAKGIADTILDYMGKQ